MGSRLGCVIPNNMKNGSSVYLAKRFELKGKRWYMPVSLVTNVANSPYEGGHVFYSLF